MRFSKLTLALALGGLFVSIGCSSLVSLQPFVGAEEAAFEPGLIGTWAERPRGNDTFIVQQDGNQYQIIYLNSNTALRFEARLLHVGDAKILDLVQKESYGLQLPVHIALRVWVEGHTLRYAFLDTEWFREQARRILPAQSVNDLTVLTAPGEAVRALIATYGMDPKAYGETETLYRD